MRRIIASVLALGLTVGVWCAATSEEPDSRTWAAAPVEAPCERER